MKRTALLLTILLLVTPAPLAADDGSPAEPCTCAPAPSTGDQRMITALSLAVPLITWLVLDWLVERTG